MQERIEKHREEIEELEALEKTVDIPIPPNVVWTTGVPLELPAVPQRPEGSNYYEQVLDIWSTLSSLHKYNHT